MLSKHRSNPEDKDSLESIQRFNQVHPTIVVIVSRSETGNDVLRLILSIATKDDYRTSIAPSFYSCIARELLASPVNIISRTWKSSGFIK